MTIEDLLYALGGTTPTEVNPTPGFPPLTQHRGPSLLDGFQPSTETERLLVETARPLFGNCTLKQHQEFRLALYAVYKEQGFTVEDLRSYFPDQP